MNDGVRDLVSALLAIAYAAIILVVGELYINHRSKLPAISVKPQPSHATPATQPAP
jgi:hypothetical protein